MSEWIDDSYLGEVHTPISTQQKKGNDMNVLGKKDDCIISTIMETSTKNSLEDPCLHGLKTSL